MGSFLFFAWAGEYLIYYRGLSMIPGNHHFEEKSKKKVPWAVVYQNDGLRWISPGKGSSTPVVEDPPEGFMVMPPALAVPAAWRMSPGASPSVGVA
jgi:hypothetical protein